MEKMNINYGIIAIEVISNDGKSESEIGIVHFIGYDCPITDEMVEQAKNELNTDEDFHLVGRIDVDVFVMEAPPDIVNDYKKLMEKTGMEELYKTIKK